MDRGQVDVFAASKVCAAAGWLPDDKASEVDAVLVGRLLGKDPTQVRNLRRGQGRSWGFGRRAKERRNPAGSPSPSRSPVRRRCRWMMATWRMSPRRDESRTLDQLRADVAPDLLLSEPVAPW
jgi:hypothetical protein